MIGKLTGRMDSSGENWAMIDVGGVGYLAFCSTRTLSRLPGVGEAARLWIETHVREDHIHLYGFIEPAERDWFRLLSTVQGVGAKMALAILSVLGPGDLLQAIASGDKTAMTRASGVGPKLAQRLITELKDKVGKVELGGAAALHGTLAEGVSLNALDGVPEDAVQALVSLGYGRSDAFGAVARAARDLGKDAGLQAIIKAGLKELAS